MRLMTDVVAQRPAPLPTAAQAAAIGFLARYAGPTLSLYRTHLKVLFAWCEEHGLDPLALERVHLEMFRHYLTEVRGNQATTVANRLAAIRTFYRFAVIDGYLASSPADHLRIPTAHRDESRLRGLTRVELATLLEVARATDARRWALVSLLGLLGLRVSEACSVQVESTRGQAGEHRTVSFVGKGARPATMPLPAPVASAIDAAAEDRDTGPLFVRDDGSQLDRRTAHRWIRALGAHAGLGDRLHPHMLRHTMVTLALDAGVPLRDVQAAARHADPRLTERYDRQRGSFDHHAAHALVAYVAGATDPDQRP
ncbi:tyrosine-type recombinase/integrase [Georgenia sp. MJ173]|uniref:tyrosine-type recombinase/integrase n=1 Tax=Georgenia sunbinii TaxID=3117728 RepID=UPI002F2662C3